MEKNSCSLIAFTLFTFLLNIKSHAQITDRTFRFGDETSITHVAPLGDDRWLAAGTTWSLYSSYPVDSIFMATLNDAGEVLSIFFPILQGAETHYISQLLPLPNGDVLLVFETTLCDVSFYINTVRRYNAAGEMVWEITTNTQTYESPPRGWEIAPDGNLIGLIDNELWKINAETGATIWKTVLFNFQPSNDPKVFRFTLILGSENLLGFGNPTLSFWTQHITGGGDITYTPESTLSLPNFDAFSSEVVARTDGWIYLLDRYYGNLLRTKEDLQPEVLTAQPGHIVEFKMASNWLYFLERLETGTRFYKTDLDGNGAQDLDSIANLLIPVEMAIVNDKAFIGGADGSGPNIFPGTVNYYPRPEVEHAWARVAPLSASTNNPTIDVGIMEAITLTQPSIDAEHFDFPPYTLYNVSGGIFNLKITNHGNSTLEKVWVNHRFEEANSFNICPVTEINTQFYEGLNLAPGESAWVTFEGIRSNYRISVPSKICFWTSGPNDEPDFDKSNDHACAEIISSVDEADTAPKLRVYPNPVLNDHFIVALIEPSAGSQWQMTDVLGRIVGTGMTTFGAIEHKIEVANLPPGIYYLKIGGGTSRIVVD